MKRLASLFAKVGITLRGLFGMSYWRTGWERYGLTEKPEGWNDAVLGFFHSGPEGRIPTPEFADAFAERARVTSRKERTLAAAADFRQAACDLPMEPEPGVHPAIHEAMRQSFITKADELEREAEQL